MDAWSASMAAVTLLVTSVFCLQQVPHYAHALVERLLHLGHLRLQLRDLGLQLDDVACWRRRQA